MYYHGDVLFDYFIIIGLLYANSYARQFLCALYYYFYHKICLFVIIEFTAFLLAFFGRSFIRLVSRVHQNSAALMDDDYDYVPQISTLDDWQNLGGQDAGAATMQSAGSTGSGLYDGQQGGQQQRVGFPGMMHPQQQQQNFPGAEYVGQGSFQANPGFVTGPVGMQQMMAQQQRQMMGMPSHQYQYAAGTGPQQTTFAPAQQPATTGKSSGSSKAKSSKRSKKAAASETSVAKNEQAQFATGHPPFQSMPGQTGGFYYKGSGPGGQPSQQQMQQQQPPMAGQGTQQAMSNKWPYQQQLEEQQRQQQQQYPQQQPQIGAIGQPQQAQQQQHYGPLQHLQSQYGTAQAPIQPQYPNFAQQQPQSTPQAQKPMQEQQPQKNTMPSNSQQYGTSAQQHQLAASSAYYGQQFPQQQQQVPGTYMGMPQQPQQASNYPMPYGYSSAAMQKQAYYTQQQMGAGSSTAGGGQVGAAGYYQQPQPYMMPNHFLLQQHQIYRDLCECEQQLNTLMPQAQQNQEAAMRVEKLHMHRQYLHSQMAQMQAATAAAAAAAAGSPSIATAPPPAGMAPAQQRPSAEPQQLAPPQPQSVQYQQYPTGQQQGHQLNVQQKMLPTSQQPPPSFVSTVPQQAQYPPAPGPPAGFHSPGSSHSSSSQQQPTAPQQGQQLAQPPHQYAMSSPSVAVMCQPMSASNQVQVNIRPELPGRTLISVYHSQDVPSSNIQPAVVSSATMPYSISTGMQMQQPQMAQIVEQNAQNLSAKDSIPPEPLPPNLAQEQKRRQQHQKQMEQQRLEHERAQLQQRKEQVIQQQIQPVQPSPPLPTHQDREYQVQRKSPLEHSNNPKGKQQQQQHEPQKPAMPPPPKSPALVTSCISLNFVAKQSSSDCTKIFPIVQHEVVELTVDENKEKPAEVEPQKTVEEPPIVPESKEELPKSNEDNLADMCGEEQPSEISELLNQAEQQKKQQLQGDSLLEDLLPKGDEIERLLEESQRELEGPKGSVVGKNSQKASTSKLNIALGFESETMTPSASDLQLESKADDKDSTADDSQWPGSSTKETTPQDPDDFPFSFRTDTKPAGSSSATRKSRKKRKMDWNRDEDDDYVGSKKKKKIKVPKVEVLEEELDDDFLVEKRRSTRKNTTGKKTKYGDDSENDDMLGEPLPPQQQQIAEPFEEKVIEKILGVRLAKRKVKRRKDSKIEKEDEPEKAEDTINEAEQSEDVVKEEDTPINGEKEKDDAEKQTSSPAENEEKIEEEKTEEDANDDGIEGKKEEVLPNEEETDVTNAEAEKRVAEEEDLKMDVDEKKVEETPKEAESENLTPPEVEEVEEVEELYVKFKGYSYLHCEWKTIEELEELGDKRVLAKLNRWKQKFGDAITVAGEDDEQEYFNEDYTVVARILDETFDDKEDQHYVFVKWKALPYEDCTWELYQDVPEQKVEEFRRRIELDPFKLKELPRPSPSQWSSRLAIPKEKLYKNDNILREYQHEGVNWLLWTWTNGRNCILADEMGLGKTVQTIVFFQSIYDIGIHGPFLVVVPLSTLGNWEREFENWTDINAMVYHGGANSRRIIQEYEFFYKRTAEARKRNIPKFDALITTYEVVVQEVEVLRKINFRVCVIDEAHRIKNRNCKLLQSGLLSLKMEHRVLLTGTPLQNNIQELFSLLNFLEPDQFANSEAFLQQFGQCQTEEQVQKLQEILKPMMLRRLKEDVEKELQPKEETIIEVQLSNIQKKYYRAVLERNFTHLMKGTTPSLINTMMQLRKCCNHPYLINGAEEQILTEFKQSNRAKSEEELQVIGLISSSGKLVLIDKLLPKLHADGHKVLIFSQMVRVLDLLEEYMNIKGYPFERIDGNIRGNDRQAAIDRFSKPENKDRFVFLLCTRAGGLGINLTAADTVIIFDSDWNPQNDLQAQARCHRIGQTKPVKIYRLITANTYEREMFDKASLKLGLDKAVLQSMLHRGDTSQQMSRQEVEDLLRKGAYGAIMDEDNEGKKFSEEDIDTILQRRTHTIRLEPGVKGSTFAKASFTTSHNRDDIDIGDPDFWSKWAKKANIDVDSLHDDFSSKHLIVHEPRSRKKRFEADNFKGNSESGDEALSDDDERQSTPSASRIAEGVKSRSARKKRRAGANGAEEDDDAYKPDELAFNKSVYFKVEKLLTQWGWGRWTTLKQSSELSEHELEHIARTLLLHCIREFRGDEKIQEYVWTLITPANELLLQANSEQKEKKETEAQQSKPSGAADTKSKFHQGWAALPEFNPPFICVDATFQRHLHRHSNKLLNRIQHLHFLLSLIDSPSADAVEPTLKAELSIELPENLDAWLIMPQWDRECDKDLLLGVYKHGMENWEQIRTDPGFCFAAKTFQFPNTLDLNNRFKYLISLLQKRAETAATAQPGSASSSQLPPSKIELVKWTKVEESDFMRILRNYGVKDDTNSENVINWVRFRELSICLHKKTNAEMLEMLYCVLAMCTKQQGGMLSPVDERRADRVDMIQKQAAEKLMNRLHLMRKVHAIITMGIQNIRGMLKMVALDVMPKGWTEAHDEHLLIVVDKFGLEDIHGKLKLLPKLFEAIQPLDEQLLLRRVVEICATLENGKWSGPAQTTNLEDEPLHPQQPCSSNQLLPTGKPGIGARAGGGGNGRKKAETNRHKSTATPQLPLSSTPNSTASQAKGIIGTSSSSGKQPTMSYNEQQILIKMMEQMSNPQYLLQLMNLMGPAANTSTGTSAASSSNSASLQQQFQQLQTLLTLSALGGSDMNAANLTASLASLAAGMGTSTAATPSSTTLPAKSGSADVLNLSKRSTIADTTTKLSLSSAISGTISKSNAASSTAVKPVFTNADACLSTGLSTSAINKLSQMSVPELLAYSNLAPETRIPVVHGDTQQRLDGDKAPQLKQLDGWLKTNSKYSVDLLTLATSHPSLFSGTNALPSSSTLPKTPTTPAQKKVTTPTVATTPSVKSEKILTTTATSLGQQLTEQVKKSTGTTNPKSASNSLSSAVSSLFGMTDLQSAQNSAALNQFLVGLTTTPSMSQNQQQQSSTTSLTAATGTQSANAASLKSMEQQLMLIQQAALLGGAGTGAAAFNPYTALLYQNPSDLFGLKSTSTSSSASASLASSALGGGQSSSTGTNLNDPSAMAAALAQAAIGGFPSTDLNAALTSELYLAAMASSIPFLGGTTTALQQQASNSNVNNTSSLYSNSNNTLEQLLAAAGIGTFGQAGTGSTSAQSKNIKTESKQSVPPPTQTPPNLPRAIESPTTTLPQQQIVRRSGGKGLKLNAVLEKLASAGAGPSNSVFTASTSATELTQQEQNVSEELQPETTKEHE